MTAYLLLLIAALLFATQFLFEQQYQRRCGKTLTASLALSAYTGLIGFLIMLISGGFRLEWGLPSFLLAALYAAASMAFTSVSLKDFSAVNLAVYSMFAMLGGMVLPFFYGIAFGGEPLTVFKVLCTVLIAGSLVLNCMGQSHLGRNIRYYAAVFLLNGCFGVISAIHQNQLPGPVDASSFMAYTQLVQAAAAVVWLLLRRERLPKLSPKLLGCVAGLSGFSVVGNAFLLLALKTCPASVQYPMITGGVIVFSVVISLLQRERVSKANLAAAALSLAATVLLVF